MSTSRTISVSMPDAQYRETEKIARKANTSLSAVVREALRCYQTQLDKQEAASELAAVVTGMRRGAKATGDDRITMDEINAEIGEVRKERGAKRAIR